MNYLGGLDNQKALKLVCLIAPYLQFFLGAKAYSQDQMFGVATLVDLERSKIF